MRCNPGGWQLSLIPAASTSLTSTKCHSCSSTNHNVRLSHPYESTVYRLAAIKTRPALNTGPKEVFVSLRLCWGDTGTLTFELSSADLHNFLCGVSWREAPRTVLSQEVTPLRPAVQQRGSCRNLSRLTCLPYFPLAPLVLVTRQIQPFSLSFCGRFLHSILLCRNVETKTVTLRWFSKSVESADYELN